MKRLIVFSLVMVFMACLIIAQQQKPNIVNKDVFDEIEEEAWQEIDKILQKVIDADTDEEYFAIPKEERDKLNKALAEIYFKTEDKELKEVAALFMCSPGERYIIEICQQAMNKQQKEWQKYVDEIYNDYNRQRRELISRCFWTGYYSGSQNRIGITATDVSKMMKETEDFKKLERKLRDVEDLLGFVITDLERRQRNNLDIRIKPPR